MQLQVTHAGIREANGTYFVQAPRKLPTKYQNVNGDTPWYKKHDDSHWITYHKQQKKWSLSRPNDDFALYKVSRQENTPPKKGWKRMPWTKACLFTVTDATPTIHYDWYEGADLETGGENRQNEYTGDSQPVTIETIPDQVPNLPASDEEEKWPDELRVTGAGTDAANGIYLPQDSDTGPEFVKSKNDWKKRTDGKFWYLKDTDKKHWIRYSATHGEWWLCGEDGHRLYKLKSRGSDPTEDKWKAANYKDLKEGTAPTIRAIYR